MWELDRDTGMYIYRHEGYVMTTSSTWTNSGTWVDGGVAYYDYEGKLHEFEPKPRCIFDEKKI